MKGSTGWKGSCCTCKGLPPSWIGTCFLFLQIQSFERFLLLATSTTTTTDSLTLFPSFCRECFLSIDQNISFPFKSNHSNQRVFDSLKTRKREKRFLSIIQKLSLPSIQIFHLLKNLTIQRSARPLAGGGAEVLFSFLLYLDWGQIVPLSFFETCHFPHPECFLSSRINHSENFGVCTAVMRRGWAVIFLPSADQNKKRCKMFPVLKRLLTLSPGLGQNVSFIFKSDNQKCLSLL